MKRKLIFLITALLAITMLFTSCGKTVSVDRYLNSDYDLSNEALSKHSLILEETEKYALLNSNDEFALFAATKDNASIVYQVFGMNAKKIVKSFTDTKVKYNIEFFKDMPVFLVETITSKADSDSSASDVSSVTDENTSSDFDISYTLYDSLGNEIKTTKYKPEAPTMFTHDILIYDYAAYKIADGVLEKKADIPEYLLIDHCDYYSNSYYYVINDSYIDVFDEDFNSVLNYTVPDYSLNANFYPLNNGDILVQYTYVVDEDETKYDISLYSYGVNTYKVNLESLIVSPDNGKIKELDLEHYVLDVYTNQTLKADYDDDNNPYTSDFDNIAIVAPIVDRMLDTSDANCDLVLMSDKGKLGKSLKTVENQDIVIPQKIGDGLYMAKTLSGYAIIDDNGDIVKTFQKDMENMGAYFVGERALYDLKLEKVYDLKENKAEIIGYVSDTIFVKSVNDNGYTIISFYNGEQKTVYTYSSKEKSTLTFTFNADFGYLIFDSQNAKYNYYNAKGELILASTVELSVLCKSDSYETVVLKGSNESYHIFTTAE
ncbi:MAG: hypothetical protein IJ038_06980 [Clostridia bacterium]|nr:hypothetical protein [Clostridia bacterium]